MNAPVNQRVSPSRVVLILGVLLAVWLGFQFFPRKESPTPPVAPVVTESKLRAVGLADNPDWDGLPEIFAIWADQAEWKDGKTRFAYWHPVMKDYSYFFEATQTEEGYHFREIAEPPTSDIGNYWDESLSGDCPIRFYRSAELMKGHLPLAPKNPVLDREKSKHVPLQIPLDPPKPDQAVPPVMS